jgi:peptidoglycan hydrolase-like protein with peptidoglycan-binding domain
MNLLRYGVAVGLLAGLGACSSMGGGSGQASRSTAMAQPTMAPDMVRGVQSKLRDDGYYKQGSVDGVWGSGTEAAVRSFQQDHNLGASGQLDVPTLQALNLAGGPPVTANSPPNNTAMNNSGPTQPMRTDPTPNSPQANTTAAQPPR